MFPLPTVTTKGGVCVYAGWRNVVQSLVEAGWGRLEDDEHIKQAKIDENGVTLVIEKNSAHQG